MRVGKLSRNACKSFARTVPTDRRGESGNLSSETSKGSLLLRGRNMIELHPEIVEKDGKKQFVILPYEEFVAIEEALADVEDLAALRAAKKEEQASSSVPLDQVMKDLEISR